MADLIWPAGIVPGASALSIIDGSGRFVSPFSGYTTTVSRPGATRLSLSLDIKALSGQTRAALHSFLAGLQGGVNRVWMWDHSYTQRGSFPASELLGNVAFDATTGWSASGELTLYATEGELRLTRTAVTADRYVNYSQITGLTSGAAYVARAIMRTGKGSEAWALRVGSTAGAATYIDTGRQSDPKMARKAATIGATTAYFSLYDYYQNEVPATRSVGDFQRFSGVSFSRCFLVNGASQTGTGVIVDALPISTNGLLLPGDQVQIGDQLNFVAAPLNSDGSGNGYLNLTLPLRVSPANNDPVIVYRPMSRFLLAESENGWSNSAGQFSATQVTLIEG